MVSESRSALFDPFLRRRKGLTEIIVGHAHILKGFHFARSCHSVLEALQRAPQISLATRLCENVLDESHGSSMQGFRGPGWQLPAPSLLLARCELHLCVGCQVASRRSASREGRVGEP